MKFGMIDGVGFLIG